MPRFSKREISSAHDGDERLVLEGLISFLVSFYTAPADETDFEEFALTEDAVKQVQAAIHTKKDAVIYDRYGDSFVVYWGDILGNMHLKTAQHLVEIPAKSKRMAELKEALRIYAK